MVWNDERIAQLMSLWEEGLTTGEIGKRLGVSKNAVVGKAHRLGLNGRPSPIKRTAKEDAPKDSRIRSVVDLSAITCRWPIGDPKDPGFHFCGARIAAGKPYCAEHASVAYVSSSKSRSKSGANAA